MVLVIDGFLTAPERTAGAITWKWKEHNFTRNRPQPGAPQKISDRGVKRIIRIVFQETMTTVFKFRKTWN